MKKRDLLKEMRKIARENQATFDYAVGGKHDKFRVNGMSIPVPRHTEIREPTARAILHMCRTYAKRN